MRCVTEDTRVTKNENNTAAIGATTLTQREREREREKEREKTQKDPKYSLLEGRLLAVVAEICLPMTKVIPLLPTRACRRPTRCNPRRSVCSSSLFRARRRVDRLTIGVTLLVCLRSSKVDHRRKRGRGRQRDGRSARRFSGGHVACL